MATQDYWVYVLRNAAGKFYIGVTTDVSKRLEQHNNGESKWTARYRPWTLVWTQGPMSLTDARKMENRLKSQRGGNGFFVLTGLTRSSGS